ncbi:MAM domain-containing glycosylphosphatidylinositol anchor protein 1-like [Limulus polyphemus]|uniref:MAM domain-containing glycosylphosphatidylinositol anchor protein 1-like n=1 Tax=Limulus polyphemus TaxID=6850 RepID=A0ABM1RYD6_LIMPO|nr:MAM domain-containing glycosylphosphatidylinositol anchor protein 1-like [Limulus polyphemus]
MCINCHSGEAIRYSQEKLLKVKSTFSFRDIFYFTELVACFTLKHCTCTHVSVYILGWYLYTEASYPRKPGDRARILSPVFQGDSYARCLTFYYHMYGEDMGMLQVLIQQDKNTSELWQRAGNLGDLWRKKAILFQPELEPFQIFDNLVCHFYRSYSKVGLETVPGATWLSMTLF